MRRVAAMAAVVAFAPLMSACAFVDRWIGREDAPSIADAPGQIEAVHAAAIVQDQAVFWVSSNGCTEKADLLPVVRQEGDASVITLRRLKQDRCQRPSDQGVEMRWTFQEMGLAPGARVSVENPYQLPRG